VETDVEPAPLAPRGLRLAAAVADLALSLVPLAILLVALWPLIHVVTTMFTSGEAPEGAVARLLGGPVAAASTGLIAVSVALASALSIWQWFLLATTGATVGKRLAGVRVVAMDRGRAGFSRAVALRVWGFGVLCMLPYIGWVVGAVDVIPLFLPARRCLHDYFAGTQVVQPRAPQLRSLIALIGAALTLAALVAIASAAALKGANVAADAAPAAPPTPPVDAPVPAPAPPPAPVANDDDTAIFVYTDEQGTPTIVQGLKKVPERFRGIAVKQQRAPSR
jgi:uncharacterized RDD family membrane protein YckC